MKTQAAATRPISVPENPYAHVQAESSPPQYLQNDIDSSASPSGNSAQRLRGMFPQRPNNKVKTPDEAALTIAKFFRKAMAADAYHHMFSRGECFSGLGYERFNHDKKPQETQFSKISKRINQQFMHLACLAPMNTDEAKTRKINHPESLQMLDTISSANLNRIKGLVGAINSEERGIFSAAIETPWHFRHQTNANVETGKTAAGWSSGEQHLRPSPVILSNRSLHAKEIPHDPSIGRALKAIMAHDDFVFFGVEFNDQSIKENKLESRTHTGRYYGDNAYILPENDDRAEHGYMTLRNHCAPKPCIMHLKHEIQCWASSYNGLEVLSERASRLNLPKYTAQNSNSHNEKLFHAGNIINMLHRVSSKIVDYDFTDPLTEKSAMFSSKDMRLGLALHLIKFLRTCGNENFKRYAYTHAKKNSEELHRVINLIFQPEFHIPKIWSSIHFNKIKTSMPRSLID